MSLATLAVVALPFALVTGAGLGIFAAGAGALAAGGAGLGAAVVAGLGVVGTPAAAQNRTALYRTPGCGGGAGAGHEGGMEL